MNITTYLQYGEDEFYMVDTGVIENSFEATTSLITLSPITVTNSVTSGTTSYYTIIFNPEASVPENGIVTIQVPPTIVIDKDKVTAESSFADGTKPQFIDIQPKIDPGDPNSPGLLTYLVNEEIKGGYDHTFILGGVDNPRTNKKTGNFVINTFSDDRTS